MQSSQVPAKFGVVWASGASSAYIQQVPETFIGTPNGTPSLTLGWGPETFEDPTVGGIAPLGEYDNGLNNQMTANLQWIQAGGIFTWDSAFSTKIGGYPKGAIVASATYSTFWKSTAENNTVNPDTGTLSAPASGWSVLQPGAYPWSQIYGAPNFVLTSAFTGANQQLATNGFQKTPWGDIQQWAEFPITGGGSKIVTISYPIPFTTSANRPRVQADNPSSTNPSSNDFIGVSLISHTLTNCSVKIGSGGSNFSIQLDVRGT